MTIFPKAHSVSSASTTGMPYPLSELFEMDNQQLLDTAKYVANDWIQWRTDEKCRRSAWQMAAVLELKGLRVPINLLPAPRNDNDFLAMWYNTSGQTRYALPLSPDEKRKFVYGVFGIDSDAAE